MKTIYVSKASPEDIKNLESLGYKVIDLTAPEDEGGPTVSPMVAMGLLLMVLSTSILLVGLLAAAIAQDPQILLLILPIAALGYFFLGKNNE